MCLIYHKIGPLCMLHHKISLLYMLHKNHLTWILIAFAIKDDASRNTLNGIGTCDLLQCMCQVRCINSILRR